VRNKRNHHVHWFNDSLPSDPKHRELCSVPLSHFGVESQWTEFFASEWLGGRSMSTLTKTYLDIFRDFLPREYPSTNNIVIFLRFYYVLLRDWTIRQNNFSPSWVWFVLPESATSTDTDFPVSLLESHPVAGRKATPTFLPYHFCFFAP
jgi:hypothetical protein